MGSATKENEPRAKANQKVPQSGMAQRTLLSFFKPPSSANVPTEQKSVVKPEDTKRVADDESDIPLKVPESPSKKPPTASTPRPNVSRASPTPGAQDTMDLDNLEGDNMDDPLSPKKRSVSTACFIFLIVERLLISHLGS
jgi:hypothetical protein